MAVFSAGAIAAACVPAAAAPQLDAADEAPACHAVPVVALLLDKSRSAPGSLVSQLTVHDLDPVVKLLRTCGGELAVGTIRDRTTTPMVRLFIEAPPRPPVREELPTSGNPMLLRERRARAERAYNERRTAFDARLRRWAAAADEASAAFGRDVRALIEESPNAPATNIWAALRQADLFLNEASDVGSPAPAGTSGVRRVLVALTDGLHTTPGRAYQLQSKPELFVVNSSGEVGVLAGMHPRRFESFVSATRAIAGPSVVTH